MADTAVIRREMRRRKILENSEDRLRKLSALESTSHKGAVPSVNWTSKEVTDSKTEESGSNFGGHRLKYRNLDLNFHNAYHAMDNDEDDSDDGGYQHIVPNERLSHSSNIQTFPKILSENKPCLKVKSREGIRTTSKSVESSFPVDIALSRKWLSSLLALFAYILVFLFGHTVLNKCLILCLSMRFGVVCLAVLTADEQQQLPQGILFKALVCSGVKFSAYFVALYKAVGEMIEDIAVFLFTFFMCFWWIEAILHIMQVDPEVLKIY